MTTQPPQSAPPSAGPRPRRSGPQRIAFGYGIMLLAAAVGSVGLLVGLLGMDRCTAEGFECLGWLFIGGALWAVISVAVVFVLAHLTRIGWPFVVVTLGLLAAVAAVPGEELVRLLVAVLVPAFAAYVTSPRSRAGGGGGDTGTDRVGWHRRILIGVIGVVVLAVVLGVAGAVKTAGAVSHRADLYEQQGVHPIGLPDDRGWTYPVVIESPTATAGFSYRMEDGFGNEISVDIEDRTASAYDPPEDCSPDPQRHGTCHEVADGVWVGEQDDRRMVTTDQVVATVHRTNGPLTHDELTELAGQLEPQSYRWLATRDCRICRLV